MTYTKELHMQGLPYIGYREGFRRWGVPNKIIRNNNVDALFGGPHPDAATVFIDDFNGGQRMAVVEHKNGGE